MSYDRLNALKPVCIERLSNKLRGFCTENKHRQAAAAATLSSTTSVLTGLLRSRPTVDFLLVIMSLTKKKEGKKRETVTEETFSPD